VRLLAGDSLTLTPRPQHDEKLHIARQSLLPKQLRANALSPELVSIADEVLLFLITAYTREAGVRSLERHIGSVCRAKAVEYSEAKDQQSAETVATAGSEKAHPAGYRVEVTREDVERILGPSRFDEDEGDRDGRVGVVNGLAYQGSGNGGILSESGLPHQGASNLRFDSDSPQASRRPRSQARASST
jgi:ATP-dependent Lon protease